MQIRRLRHQLKSDRIIGQIVNIPVCVNNMCLQLPRHLDDDYSFNIHIKRKLLHKTSYLSGLIKKSTVKKWLNYLLKTPLYKKYNITVDNSFLDSIDKNINENHCLIEAIEE